MNTNTLKKRYDFRLGAALLIAILITATIGLGVTMESTGVFTQSSKEKLNVVTESTTDKVQSQLDQIRLELGNIEDSGSASGSMMIKLVGGELSEASNLSDSEASEVVSESERLDGIFYRGQNGNESYLVAKNSDENAVLVKGSDLAEKFDESPHLQTHVFMNGEIIGSTNYSTAERLKLGEGSGVVVSDSNAYSSRSLDSISGTVAVSKPEEFFNAGSEIVTSGILTMILVSTVSLALIGGTIGSNTSIHLKRLSEKARKMGDGDLEVEFESDRSDEVGQLYESLDNTRVSLKENIEKAERKEIEAKEKREQLEQTAQKYQDVMEECAKGNLRKRVSVDEDSKAMKQIGETFNSMMDDLEGTISQMKSFTEEVSDSLIDFRDKAEDVMEKSKDMEASVTEIEEGSQQQYNYLDEVSGEIENLSTNAQEMAESADEAAESSREAREKGQKGQEMAENAVNKVKDIQNTTEDTVDEIEKLSENMDKIDEIVDVITEVAEQTDMIAVNASVEASRAGEGGESFAVVAEEIKRLAEETKDSASQIESQIHEIRNQTDRTVERVNETNEGVKSGVDTIEESIGELEDVIEQVESMDSTIQDVGDITSDQAKSSKSIADKIQKVSDISQRTNSKTNEVGETARDQKDSMEDVREETEEMAKRAKELKDIVSEFEVNE